MVGLSLLLGVAGGACKKASSAAAITAVEASTIPEKKLSFANEFRTYGDTITMNIEWAVDPTLQSTGDMKFRLTDPPGMRQFIKVLEPNSKEPTGGAQRYSPGRVAGDAQLFSLETGARVGAFPFDTVQSGDASISGDDEAKELERSLRADVFFGLQRELQKLVSGAEVGASSGVKGASDKFKVQILGKFASPEFLTAFVDKVEFGKQDDKMLVTLYAMTPSSLNGKMDKVRAIVTSVLGVDDVVIRIEKSSE